MAKPIRAATAFFINMMAFESRELSNNEREICRSADRREEEGNRKRRWYQTVRKVEKSLRNGKRQLVSTENVQPTRGEKGTNEGKKVKRHTNHHRPQEGDMVEEEGSRGVKESRVGIIRGIMAGEGGCCDGDPTIPPSRRFSHPSKPSSFEPWRVSSEEKEDMGRCRQASRDQEDQDEGMAS